mmetsp:Transcript_19503/g.54282  ORF Transcript_19503/g.54282 Transcript_19503/m.54282 type:complete len:912 (-) Transcript_19503:897-3632(-)
MPLAADDRLNANLANSPPESPIDEGGLDEISAIFLDAATETELDRTMRGINTSKVFTADDWKMITTLVDQLIPTCILDFQSKFDGNPNLMSGYGFSFKQGVPSVKWPDTVDRWTRSGGDVRMVIHIHTSIPWGDRKEAPLEGRLEKFTAVNIRYAFREQKERYFKHTWKPTQKLKIENDLPTVRCLIQIAHCIAARHPDFWYETENRSESNKRLRGSDFRVVSRIAPASDLSLPPCRVSSFCIGIDMYDGEHACLAFDNTSEHLKLEHAVADARAFHSCVQEIGGYSDIVENLQNSFDITKKFRDFLKGLKSRDPKVVFLYCAGHGVQCGSDLFIIPGGVWPKEVEDLRSGCVSLNKLFQYMKDDLDKFCNPNEPLFVAIVDACRSEADDGVHEGGFLVDPNQANCPRCWALVTSCSRGGSAADSDSFTREILHKEQGIFGSGIRLRTALENAGKQYRRSRQGSQQPCMLLLNIDEELCVNPSKINLDSKTSRADSDCLEEATKFAEQNGHTKVMTLINNFMEDPATELEKCNRHFWVKFSDALKSEAEMITHFSNFLQDCVKHNSLERFSLKFGDYRTGDRNLLACFVLNDYTKSLLKANSFSALWAHIFDGLLGANMNYGKFLELMNEYLGPALDIIKNDSKTRSSPLLSSINRLQDKSDSRLDDDMKASNPVPLASDSATEATTQTLTKNSEDLSEDLGAASMDLARTANAALGSQLEVQARLQAELALGQSEQARLQAEQRYEELEAKMHFMRSITNTNPELVFEVTAMRRMSPPAGLRRGFEEAAARMEARADLAPPEKMRRMVFHTAPADALARIEQEGMRPCMCSVCLKPTSGVWPEHDAGFFGNHALGVYVSRHADYTFYYQRQRKVQPGDTVRETPCPPLPSRLPQIQGVSIPNRSALSQPE